MKILSSVFLMVVIAGSTVHAQQSRLLLEHTSFPDFGKPSRASLTQIRIKTPCKRNTLAFRLKGVFKFKREYASPYDFKSTKCFTVNIHPYRIHVKPPKTKFL